MSHRISFYFCSVAIACALPAQAQTVTVSPGDTLAIIAAERLGQASRWRDICRLNSELLAGDCDLIIPGMTLRLTDQVGDSRPVQQEPTAASEPEISAEPAPLPTLFEVPLEFATNGEFTIADTTLSGFVDSPGAGGRPAVYAVVPTVAEEAASDKRIRVRVTLVSDSPTTALAAYSTADVGNSGWRTVAAGPGGVQTIFEYDVPPIRNGNGDYIGFQPDPENTGQSVTVTALEIEVVP